MLLTTQRVVRGIGLITGEKSYLRERAMLTFPSTLLKVWWEAAVYTVSSIGVVETQQLECFDVIFQISLESWRAFMCTLAPTLLVKFAKQFLYMRNFAVLIVTQLELHNFKC